MLCARARAQMCVCTVTAVTLEVSFFFVVCHLMDLIRGWIVIGLVLVTVCSEVGLLWPIRGSPIHDR